MTPLQRRLAKVEANSKWGSAAEIAASKVVFMRIPEGAMNDPHVTAAQESAVRKGKFLHVTTLPEAEPLPLWALVPLDRIPEALLEARLAELGFGAALASEEALAATIAELRAAIAQEGCAA